MLHHFINFRKMLFNIAEIACHAVFKFFCLADIDDLSAFIVHYIDAGFHRKTQRFFMKIW